MPRRKHKHSRKVGGVESCPGYTDENNIWNNGFACPRWGGPDQRYCCQEDGRHFCCPEPTARSGTEERMAENGKSHKLLASFNLTTVMLSTNAVLIPTQPADSESLSQYIPIIASLCAAIILVFLCSLICCFLCQCCPLHRSRKTKSDAAGERTSAATPCAACSEQCVGSVAPPSEQVGRLHCGCHSCGTPASSLHTQPFLPSLGSLNSSWQTDLEKLSEHPPAYTDGQLASDRSFSPGLPSSRSGLQGSWSGLQGSRSGLQGVPDNSTASQQGTRWSSTDPSVLCMTTFRPLSSPRTTATVLPTLVTPPVPPVELWRRDSGVLVEEPDAENCTWARHVSPSGGGGGKMSKYDMEQGMSPSPGFLALS